MVALEPDFHLKPPVELYNLVEDPEENNQPGRTRTEAGGFPEGPDGSLDCQTRSRNRVNQTNLQPT